MERRYILLNVFTKTEEGGNPLAVMTEVDRLDDDLMQAIAKKIGLSETVFVFPPKNPAHTAAIRIFTPASELPFAGHPTVGTAICLTQERVWRARDTEFDALSVLEAKAGTLRVGVKPAGGEVAFAEFDTPGLPSAVGETPPNDRIAAALGLSPTDIGFENFKPRRFAAGGLPFTFVPVSGLDAIKRAQVVEEHWSEAFGDEHPDAYVYCRETVKHKSAFHARAFVPAMGLTEDPATGSAAAAFAGVIRQFDSPPEGTYRGIIEQGYEMGRPSEIFLEFEIRNRDVRVVRIGGYGISLGERTVEI